jgi:hypothetical protein
MLKPLQRMITTEVAASDGARYILKRKEIGDFWVSSQSQWGDRFWQLDNETAGARGGYPGSIGMSLCPTAVASQTHNGLHSLTPSSGSRGRCSRTRASITGDPSSPPAPAYYPVVSVISPAG